MPTKIIKLGKKDDIASVVKQIKNLRDKEVIFEVETGSPMLRSSENLKLMKRTGEVMGKKIQVATDDEIGQVLAKKVGMLAGDAEVKMPRGISRPPRMASRQVGSDVKSKFSDIILPRQVVSKVAGQVQKAFEATSVPILHQPSRFSKLPKIKFTLPKLKTKLWLFAGGILVLAIFGIVVLLPSATITVFARSEPIVRDFEIIVDQNATAVDVGKLTVPGFAVTREVSQTKNFPATGAGAGSKATGSVMIYNNTAFTLTLKAATTTLDVNGHKYLFARDVSGIKPGGIANGPVDIQAVDGGTVFNLPANTKFKITNQALGNQNVYAINLAPIAGGTNSAVITLSQKDLDDAVASLTQDVITQAQADLSAEKDGAPIKLLDSAVKKEILAHTANKNLGDVTTTFDMTLIAKVTGLAFNEKDVIGLIESKINQLLSLDKYILESAAPVYTASFKSVDLIVGRGVLATHFETVIAYKIDSTNFAKILAGKNESEIKEILLSKPEVDSVTVKFSPAWLAHSAPSWNGKVYIKTELSK